MGFKVPKAFGGRFEGCMPPCCDSVEAPDTTPHIELHTAIPRSGERGVWRCMACVDTPSSPLTHANSPSEAHTGAIIPFPYLTRHCCQYALLGGRRRLYEGIAHSMWLPKPACDYQCPYTHFLHILYVLGHDTQTRLAFFVPCHAKPTKVWARTGAILTVFVPCQVA